MSFDRDPSRVPAAVHDWHPPHHHRPHFSVLMLVGSGFGHRHPPAMSDSGGGGDDGQRQCHRRGITPDVELGAALALANMAAAGSTSTSASAAVQAQATAQATATAARLHTPTQEMMTDDDEEMASTRLSLQLGRVGMQQQQQQSPSCSSGSSSAGGRPSSGPPSSAAPGGAATRHHGPRPRQMLTEAEKEEKRLRRVLANRESARQTILRRQAIRDELARKVADLSSQNETMKKEKDVVMKEYLSLKEMNEQLKAQATNHLSLSLF